MKPIVCCVALLLLVTLSCKKDATKPVNSFLGKWDMVWVTGGTANIHMTPTQWGHNKSYTFYPDSTCTLVYDADVANTVYSTTIGAPFNHNIGTKQLIFRNTGATYEYRFTHDTMQLYPAGATNAITEWYVKQE